MLPSTMRRPHAALLLILGAFAGAACNSPSPSAVVPTAPTSMVATPAPPSGVAMSGKVYDTGNRPLAGATVEVVNGASAGLKVTTLADGSYALRGEFDAGTQFRATKAGYETGLRPMAPFCQQCNPNFWVYFFLALPVAPANLANDYTVTVTADPVCTQLPGHARQRSYTTKIVPNATQPTPANTLFAATVDGANLVAGLTWQGLWFAVAGDYLEVSMGDLHGQPGVLEQTAENGFFSVGGLGTTTLGSSGVSQISTTFEGEIIHCELKSGVAPLDAGGRFDCPAAQAIARVACQARNHQLVLTRR
jgi:hypothetical protein